MRVSPSRSGKSRRASSPTEPDREASFAPAFAAFRTIEDDPGLQVLAEILEPVRLSGGHKEKIALAKRRSLVPVNKRSRALHDDIDFVSGVGCLGVVPARGIQLDLERAPFKGYLPAPAARPWDPGHHLADSDSAAVISHKSPGEPGSRVARWRDSSSSSWRLMERPPPNPVSEPSAPMTRWHGMMIGIGFRPLAAPTAR